jgi:aminopeptidase N
VLVNGQSVSFKMEGASWCWRTPEAEPSRWRSSPPRPGQEHQAQGLYVSADLFTQCEAEGFRRITYFLDRPDVMAIYTVTLRADKAVPGAAVQRQPGGAGELDDGRHFAKWHDPPKPSYLFALVAATWWRASSASRARAGPPAAGLGAPRRPRQDRARHELADRLHRWDEARFGLPLDLDRFMIVAVATSTWARWRTRA